MRTWGVRRAWGAQNNIFSLLTVASSSCLATQIHVTTSLFFLFFFFLNAYTYKVIPKQTGRSQKKSLTSKYKLLLIEMIIFLLIKLDLLK